MKMRLFILNFFAFTCMAANAQNVGIGTVAPSEKLHVIGNIKADTLKPSALKLALNAGAGKILTSDANGVAGWQTSATSAGGNGSIGFGSWGDCSMNNVSEYNPVVDTNSATNDHFGYAVAISGNYAIVGANGNKGVNGQPGTASVYQHNGTNWVLMQKLSDPAGVGGHSFGYSVAISGDYVIVGAPFDDPYGNSDQGSAYLFKLFGGSWVFLQKINDPYGAAADRFGTSVSLSPVYAAVGSERDNINGNNTQGSACIFKSNGNGFSFMQKIVDPGGSPGDSFGGSISISGNNVIIGSKYDAVNESYQGSACIFSYNGATWGFVQKLSESLGGMNDFFGTAVSISGNYALVGVPGGKINSNQSQGTAVGYRFNGSSWVASDRFFDELNTNQDIHFGSSVCLSGNYIIIGSEWDAFNGKWHPGSATIYTKIGNGWSKVQYIRDPLAMSGDEFGYTAAIDGTNKRFIVGANAYANYAGRAVFGKINF